MRQSKCFIHELPCTPSIDDCNNRMGARGVQECRCYYQGAEVAVQMGLMPPVLRKLSSLPSPFAQA